MENVAVILAAGLGTRMKSAQPKVLHKIAGSTMLSHLISACTPVFQRIIVVVGPAMSDVASAAAPHTAVVQVDRRGTADAAKAALAEFGNGLVTLIYGDNPLVTTASLASLCGTVNDTVALVMLATRPPDPGMFGRIIGPPGYAERIVEYADATAAERAVTLCNVGGFTARVADLKRWLAAIGNNNAKNEFYLTDLVAVAHAEGASVAVIEAPWDECRGVNSRAELALAEGAMQRRLRQAALDAGVTMTAPETVSLAADTRLAPDVMIEPNVMFGPGVAVERNVSIRAFSYLEACEIREGAVIGPYARIRPGSVIGRGAHVGNFCEIKASQLDEGVKVNHLSYIGDAAIGARTNIGAGTITCNYDGAAKHRTLIGADVFVGSDVALVAPVSVGDRAIIAAGSVVTDPIAADDFAVARGRQVNKPGRAATMRSARETRFRGNT